MTAISARIRRFLRGTLLFPTILVAIFAWAAQAALVMRVEPWRTPDGRMCHAVDLGDVVVTARHCTEIDPDVPPSRDVVVLARNFGWYEPLVCLPELPDTVVIVRIRDGRVERKTAIVEKVGSMILLVGIRARPGDSGAGVFDPAGRFVSIIVGYLRGSGIPVIADPAFVCRQVAEIRRRTRGRPNA